MTDSKPLRVLQVFHIMNRGGAEAMIMNLYRRIDRTKVQFDFLVHSQSKGLFDDEIRSLGGRIFYLPAFKGYNVISYYAACRKFFAQHDEYKVVHGHLGSCAAYYLYAANQYGAFTIAHSHSAAPIRTVQDVAYYFFSYPTRFVAKKLFGCSTEAGIARYGRSKVQSSLFQVFNNAVDTNLFRFDELGRKELRKELNIKDEEVVVGSVGRITTQKNPQRIFELFSALVKNYPHVKCLWVGTGELEDYYRNQIRKEGLEDKVIMTGVRSDIPKVMHALDCMLFPSLWEGLPVSVVESQMANLPTVLADTISREVSISPLLHWHSLKEDNTVWTEDCICFAKQYKGKRNRYEFDRKATGYDIATTASWLQDFYIFTANSF